MSIKVSSVSKSYGSKKALAGISFEIKKGVVTGFLGPNGAGKTTSMKIIAGFLAPDEGKVHINGMEMTPGSYNLKSAVGFLPENNPLYPDMFVEDYLEYMAKLHGLEESRINEAIRETAGLCGLNSEFNKKIGELSKGYRQRVGLAQAIIHKPEIIILDEPTSGLDPNQIIEIRELIKELGKTSTVLFSSHILQEVEAVCSRVIIINNGKIAADREKSDLYAAKGERIRLKVAGKEIDTERLRNIKSAECIEESQSEKDVYILTGKEGMNIRKDVFDFCVSEGLYIEQLSDDKNSLESLFRELTKSNVQ